MPNNGDGFIKDTPSANPVTDGLPQGEPTGQHSLVDNLVGSNEEKVKNGKKIMAVLDIKDRALFSRYSKEKGFPAIKERGRWVATHSALMTWFNGRLQQIP